MPFQVTLQVIHVLVLEDGPLGLGQPDAIDDRCVVQLVADDHVALLDQHLQDAQVGCEARLKDQRGLRVLEVGELALQLLVN